MRVLVVEDNRDLQANIAGFLAPDVTLDFASTGPEGLRLALAGEYDVLVLDVMLPGMGGLEVLRQLRERAPRLVPVLLLTARDTLADKEEGFAAGADDYLVKPFSLAELRWRLQALARRPVPPSGRTLTLGRLSLQPDTRRVSRGTEALTLPRPEALLLQWLMEAAPAPLSAATLGERLWGEEPPPADSALRTHVYALRRALARLGLTDVVVTRRSEGYLLDVARL
jgi:DNA-binding response OmpR family regulator